MEAVLELTRPAASATRHDIYAAIHKALRAALTDALLAAGRLDSGDVRDVERTLAAVRDTLAFCREHLETENAFVHPAMEARRPGSTRGIAAEHVEHAAAIARLRDQADALEHAPRAGRAALVAAFYREFALFVGENFVHMHAEEVDHNRVLWDTYTDAELVALENAIKAHHPPAAMTRALRWMLPAMTPGERAATLTGIRAAAPAAVYGAVLALARAHVDAGGLAKLEAALAA
ncbi:MAG: hemerythrin domain-containing protein [Burkholderiales bacterium]